MFLITAPPPSPPAAMRPPAVSVRLGRGHRSAVRRLREPAGAIRLYRLSLPAGARVRATVQLRPDVTGPLEIRSVPFAPSSACVPRRMRTVCTVGEEACPMPAGVWRVRIEEAAGPAGTVTVRLRVGAARPHPRSG